MQVTKEELEVVIKSIPKVTNLVPDTELVHKVKINGQVYVWWWDQLLDTWVTNINL